MSAEPEPLKTVRVVGAILVRNGRILLACRPPARAHPDRWEFPGGKVRQGEDDTQALKRELMEELGIDATVRRRVQTVVYDYPDFRIVLVVYECDLGEQEPQCRDVAEIAWVRPEAILDYDLTPADVPVAARIRNGHV